MAEAKKGVARIQIPPKVAKTHEVEARLDAPQLQGSHTADKRSANADVKGSFCQEGSADCTAGGLATRFFRDFAYYTTADCI